MTKYRRLGIDIGGTFTDFVVVTNDGHSAIHKVASTPSDPSAAVKAGITDLAAQQNLSIQEYLDTVEVIVHGTTIATNTLIQRTGARTALVHTRGFRDILYLRDGFKPERYNLHMPPPSPLVDRYLRLEVDERIMSDGSVRTPLVESSVRDVCAVLRAEEIEAVGVALMWSPVNPAHERRVGELITSELPDVHVTLSSDILPAIREYPRTCATALSAYVGRALGTYLDKVKAFLTESGYSRELLIMQVNGGIGRVADVQRRPVFAIGSGPAAGPAAGIALARAEGDDNLLVTDMGGTSFEVTLVADGQPAVTRDAAVDTIPLGLPAADINSIGAGGGSIAWVDAGGMLRVGPQSAGADPGPACYARGGLAPTVTDANVVLGYVNPTTFLGGAMSLDAQAASDAVGSVGDALGASTDEAAAAIFQVVNANMVNAMRTVSVMRGLHPKEFTLVVGGGAAGAHASRLAAALGVEKVLFPTVASGVCAYGMVVADLVHWDVTAYTARSDKVDIRHVAGVFEDMEARAVQNFVNQGIESERVQLARFADVKYSYQVHELMTPVPSGPIDESSLSATVAAFTDQHRRLYSYAMEELPLDIIAWRLRATVTQPEHIRPTVAPEAASSGLESSGQLSVLFDPPKRRIATPVYDGNCVPAATRIHGPAIVELPTTSLTVWPGDTLERRPAGEFVLWPNDDNSK